MKLLTALFFLILSACASQSKTLDEKVVIGEKLSASRYSNLYFSAQPTMKDFETLKGQGFAAVVNLRSKSEFNESEEAEKMKSLGMDYEHVAFAKEAELSDSLINEITEVVVKFRPKGKVLVHCSTGNRVGVWLGGHFYKDHKYSKKMAKKTAKRLGLNDKKAMTKLDRYLETK